MPTIAEALQIAIQHHQAGRLSDAEQICQQILAVDANNADAWHLLGVLAQSCGQLQKACDYIDKAIALNGKQLQFHYNRGNVLQDQKRLEEAIAAYRETLILNPTFADAHNSLGTALHEQGNLEEAILCYKRAIELAPEVASAHNNLGAALKAQGFLNEAAACYHRAIQLNPAFADAHSNLGVIFKQQRNYDAAVSCYRRALALNPNYLLAYNNLGSVLTEQGRTDEAIVILQQALERKPDFVEALNNLGNAFRELNDLATATAIFHRALALAPNSAETYHNLGLVLQNDGKIQEAFSCFQKSRVLNPNDTEAPFSQSLLTLLQGKLQQGWPAYELRWQCGKMKGLYPSHTQPVWDGSDLSGKTILLHAEQGLGDTIQFIRYAILLKQNGTKVLLHCPKALVSLLECYPAIDVVIAENDPLPAFDCYQTLLSLPRIFNTAINTIPTNIPYLFAEHRLLAFWRSRLSKHLGFRVGINWHGRAGAEHLKKRSLPLELFSHFTNFSDIQLFSLQKGAITPEEQSQLSQLGVHSFGDDLDTTNGPFMDTAAIMKNLDLVITSDTSVAHLAGALGVPTWVALPFVPDWRWLLDREDSPWYPTMRLFRQTKRGEWTDVFERMAEVLKAKLQAC